MIRFIAVIVVAAAVLGCRAKIGAPNPNVPDPHDMGPTNYRNPTYSTREQAILMVLVDGRGHVEVNPLQGAEPGIPDFLVRLDEDAFSSSDIKRLQIAFSNAEFRVANAPPDDTPMSDDAPSNSQATPADHTDHSAE